MADPQTPAPSQVAGIDAAGEPTAPGFRERGRMRRRLGFLRRARELAYRDLGGLVFEMHRLGQRRDELVGAKLATLQQIDSELRTLEQALGERQGVTVLREAGVAACPRCAAIHASEDRFCPACGLAMGRHADRPVAASPPVTAPPARPVTTPPASALTVPPPATPAAPSSDPLPPTTASPGPATSPSPAKAQPSASEPAEQPTQVLPSVAAPAPNEPPADKA